jgi:hypothetical protein
MIGSVRDVTIFDEGVILDGHSDRPIYLSPNRLDEFAQADGFAHWPEMLVWFSKTHGLPFRGNLVMW